MSISQHKICKMQYVKIPGCPIPASLSVCLRLLTAFYDIHNSPQMHQTKVPSLFCKCEEEKVQEEKSKYTWIKYSYFVTSHLWLFLGMYDVGFLLISDIFPAVFAFWCWFTVFFLHLITENICENEQFFATQHKEIKEALMQLHWFLSSFKMKSCQTQTCAIWCLM